MRAQILAVLAGTSLLIAGCGAGQRAQTAVAKPVLDAVEASVGPIDLRALTVTTPTGGSYAAGGSAYLQLFIVNNGAPDKLVSVSSSAAKSAGVYQSRLDATQGISLASIPTTAAPSASASASASTSPSASASSFAVDLPSGETTSIGGANSQPQVVLQGLNAALFPAMSVPITFSFANAGSVTVQVSVHLSTSSITPPTLAITHSLDPSE